jgi:hypothetical protein
MYIPSNVVIASPAKGILTTAATAWSGVANSPDFDYRSEQAENWNSGNEATYCELSDYQISGTASGARLCVMPPEGTSGRNCTHLVGVFIAQDYATTILLTNLSLQQSAAERLEDADLRGTGRADVYAELHVWAVESAQAGKLCDDGRIKKITDNIDGAYTTSYYCDEFLPDLIIFLHLLA